MSMHKGILGQQFGGATVQSDQTLGDYIHRKQRAAAFDAVAQEKKMTFDEWWKSLNHSLYGDKPFEYLVDACEAAWKAGQKNV